MSCATCSARRSRASGPGVESPPGGIAPPDRTDAASAGSTATPSIASDNPASSNPSIATARRRTASKRNPPRPRPPHRGVRRPHGHHRLVLRHVRVAAPDGRDQRRDAVVGPIDRELLRPWPPRPERRRHRQQPRERRTREHQPAALQSRRRSRQPRPQQAGQHEEVLARRRQLDRQTDERTRSGQHGRHQRRGNRRRLGQRPRDHRHRQRDTHPRDQPRPPAVRLVDRMEAGEPAGRRDHAEIGAPEGDPDDERPDDAQRRAGGSHPPRSSCVYEPADVQGTVA